jgi:hypothetical protein
LIFLGQNVENRKGIQRDGLDLKSNCQIV